MPKSSSHYTKKWHFKTLLVQQSTLFKATVCDMHDDFSHLTNHWTENMHIKAPKAIYLLTPQHQWRYRTSLFVSVVRNKLNLPERSVSFLLRKVWLPPVAPSSAELDNTLQPHGGLRGNKRSWSHWPWLKSAVTHLLTVCSSHFTSASGCTADAPASLFNKMTKKTAFPALLHCFELAKCSVVSSAWWTNEWRWGCVAARCVNTNHLVAR